MLQSREKANPAQRFQSYIQKGEDEGALFAWEKMKKKTGVPPSVLSHIFKGARVNEGASVARKDESRPAFEVIHTVQGRLVCPRQCFVRKFSVPLCIPQM